ncbi:DNA repair and recombination protein RAD54 [Biomphalaria glabrata]
MCINADIVGEHEVHKLKPNMIVILNNGFLEDPDVQKKNSVPEQERYKRKIKCYIFLPDQVTVAPAEQSADFRVRFLENSGTSNVFCDQMDVGLNAPGTPDFYTWEFIPPVSTA